MHDIRDWSQRHATCHAMYIHQNSLWRDFRWQMHCEVQLVNPPQFQIEPRVANDRYHQFLEQTWIFQQLPWAIVLYVLGEWSFVIWGVSVRITLSLLGHWLVGYLAHNVGPRDWHLHGHAVQGHNLPPLALVTMGEAWHNNHHAFPGSARLGIRASKPDPGWWALCFLQKLGFVWNLKTPESFPLRAELRPLNHAEDFLKVSVSSKIR